MLDQIFTEWYAHDAPFNAMARDREYASFTHYTAHCESTNPRYHAFSDPYEEVAYAATYSDDEYTSIDEAFYEAMKLSIQSMPDVAELSREAPSPPKQAIIGNWWAITRTRKAKATYGAMRKRRRRQSIAFARIMGQCDEDFAQPPASKHPIALVLSPRRAAIAKFDALLGAPSASKIVGDDLHPIAQVKDFSPYVAKIKAAGADTVITGNWGSDLSLLVKAANEGGFTGKFFTYYAGVTGTPTALGSNGAGRVYQIAYNHYNMGGQMDKWMNEFKAKYNDDFYTGSTIRIFETLGAAMANAKSTDPVKVAAALEGISVKSFNGEVQMRKMDHQLQQPLYMTVWQKADKKYPYNPENTGMTLVPLKEYPNYVSSTPTSCQMKRPG